MVYRCPDGATFNSYQAMCDHMIGLARMQGNLEMVEYYKKEKEKMHKRQRSLGGRLLALAMLPVSLPVCTLLGHPENAINSVFGKD